jgi:hypothetical protein
MAPATAGAVCFRASAFGSSRGLPLSGAKGGQLERDAGLFGVASCSSERRKPNPRSPGPGERTSTPE